MPKSIGLEMAVGEVRYWTRRKVRDELGNHVANAFDEIEGEREVRTLTPLGEVKREPGKPPGVVKGA